MANARRNPATVVVGSNMYAITGFNLAPDYSTANERFNGTSWATMAPIPVPHAQSRGTAVGTNIYVPGGFNSVSFGGPLDTMQIYNTTADTWSMGMSLPAARSGVATAAFNNLVYMIGGYNPVGTGHTDVYIYNPGTNSYTTGAPMTAPAGNAAGVLFNGEIYVVGGGTAPGAQYAYNPTTNTWRTIAVLPTSGGTCQSDNGFVLNNELWIVGCLGLPINQQVWIYNSGTDSWRAGPQYNVDHQGPGAALFNSRGFVVGGGAASGGSTAVESIGPCGPTPTPTATAAGSPTSTPTATPTVAGSATPTPTCAPGNQYTIAQIGGSIVPGTTDIGNHGDDTVVTIALPFSYTLYDQTFTSINLSSNGNAQFTTTDTTFGNVCLPWAAHNYTIFPYWDDLYLVNSGFGIFTSVSGTAPNRIFNIEWRAQYFPGSGSAGFELRLYEGQTRFDIIYGTVTNGNTSATAGVQKVTDFTQYFCNGTGGAATGGQSYTLQGCGTPTPTPTATVTPTGTPSPSPTCTPGGTPGPWSTAAPVGVDHYGGFMDSDGTFAYEGGGYSFSVGDNTNEFGKFDPVANTWTPLAPVPDLINAEASGVYAPNVNKLFVFGGDSPNTGTVVNTTRIYDIATNTWSSGAPMPDVRAFMASGYFNGKIYLVGGYSTGNVDPSFGQVWEYDPLLNTFNTSRMSMPATLGGPGFGVINGHIYVAGGRNLANTNLNTLYDYDIAANTWTARANMPSGRERAGVGGDRGQAVGVWWWQSLRRFGHIAYIGQQGIKSVVQPAAPPGYHKRAAGV